jgi:uroporphyrinogen III methyltransferase/synthase
VPVSYPGGGDTITLVRGFEDASRTPPDIDWSGLSRLEGTVVCYAGAQQLPLILDALRDNGWPEDGQAAVVYRGTLPTQETLSGTIGELAALVKARTRREAAILIVGRVAGLREHLRWYDAKPLFGLKILVTRAKDQAAELSDQLAALGAEPVEAPMIRILPPDDRTPLLRAAGQLDVFDWVVFTSANAVDSLMTAVLETGGDVRSLKGPQLCAIGSATAEQLAKYGIKVDLIPPEFKADAVVSALKTRGSLDAVRVLLPRADIGREVIAEQLREAGASSPTSWPTATCSTTRKATAGPTSTGCCSTARSRWSRSPAPRPVRNFTKVLGAEQAADLLKKTIVAAIGPVTADAAARLGIETSVQPTTFTVPALVEAIRAHVVAQRAAS